MVVFAAIPVVARVPPLRVTGDDHEAVVFTGFKRSSPAVTVVGPVYKVDS